ncbi:MAG TPA: NPCBM/NEW2 domain-containing protein [Nitrosospira sp.]|nr:NPCBM/NEW2 domain-containing protein [Nitrosospira sp.]
MPDCLRFRVISSALLLLLSGSAASNSASAVDAIPHGLQPSGHFSVTLPPQAATPPMGWNPWNAFRTEVTEAKIIGIAEALQSSGLAGAGYRYVNVDDGWWLKRRADGRIVVRTNMFPSAALQNGETSLRPFVDRLHAMGLKAGLYTDTGRNACSQIWDPKSPNLPVGTIAEREIGSHDFQTQDMQLFFGEWNFDLVKADSCGLADYAHSKPAVQQGQYRAFGPYIVRDRPDQSNEAKVESLYANLSKAIAAVRPNGDTILSICTWGEAHVADWGKRHGQMWRTSPDIHATWESMLRSLDSVTSRALYAGPGRWNDPDMLQVGNGEFDADHLVEARAHISLWAMVSAPLLLGSDLKRWPRSLYDIVGNRDVIAIDQDAAGNQGIVVSRDGDAQVMVKSLAKRGTKAVALINRGARPLTVSVPLSKLHLPPSTPVELRNVWSGEKYVVPDGVISSRLRPRETTLLLVNDLADSKKPVYLDEMTARINVAEDGRAAAGPSLRTNWVPAQVNAAPSGAALTLDGKRYDHGLGVLGQSRLEVRLDKEFRRFRTTVGMLDETSQAGAFTAVIYRVYGDGKLLLENRSARAIQLDVPVQGVYTMELVAMLADQVTVPVAVAWADSRLER